MHHADAERPLMPKGATSWQRWRNSSQHQPRAKSVNSTLSLLRIGLRRLLPRVLPKAGIHTGILALLFTILLFFVASDHDIESLKTAAFNTFSRETWRSVTSYQNDGVAVHLAGDGPADTVVINEHTRIRAKVNLTSFLGSRDQLLDYKLQSSPNLVLWLQSANERLVLEEPARTAWDTWTFEFELLSPGDFNVSLYLEGPISWPTEPSMFSQQSANETAYPLVPLTDFRLHAAGATETTSARLSDMRDCTPEQLLEQRGRWMNLQTLDLSARWRSRYLPPTVLSGANDTFIPDSCLVPYISQESAQYCMKDKQISFVGDSTLEEVANDLGIHLSSIGDTLPANHDEYIGGSRACASKWYNTRLFNWRLPDIDSRISFTWAGHPGICYSGQGTHTFSDGFGKARILQALVNPDSMTDAPVTYDEERPDLLEIPHIPATPSDILVFGSALHDMVGVRDGFFDFQGYLKQISDALLLMKPYAQRHIFMPSNSIRGLANAWPRQMNAAAIPMARGAGYEVMPNYWIKQGRPRSPLPYGIFTDAHHAADMYIAKERSPWLHASTQALLMMLCGPEAYS